MGYEVKDAKGMAIGKAVKIEFPDMSETSLVKPQDVDGGIDFNTDRLDLQKTGHSSEFDWSMSAADLENVQINGLVPVISAIIPVNDLPAYLVASR